MDTLESQTIEYKREYTDEIKKSIVAFANTNGGTLYIGITGSGDAAGVENPDDTMLRVSNVVRNAIKPDVSLFVDCGTETVEGVTVVKVQVQKGTARPYYLSGKGIRPEGVYGRHGASSVPASEAAILQMIKETDGANYEDLRSLNQDLTFTETGRFFKRKNIPFGHGQQKSLRLQTPDGIYTNLGLLLSEQSTHTIKLAVFEGYEKEVFRERREFSGSLLKQLNDAYHFLDMYNHTHAEIKGLYRVEHQDYPEDALREALLNALVHRDYGFSGSILISVFENRIEFVSIGGLPKGITLDDIQLGISVPRNENLANVFYRLQLVEAYGTGIPKIMRSYMDHQQQPSLQASSNAFKITLPNRNVNTVARKQPSYDFVRESTPAFGYYGEYDGPAALTESEEKALALFQKQPIVVRKDVEAALSVSQPMAVRVLRGLLDKGRIRSMGAGKNTRYTAR